MDYGLFIKVANTGNDGKQGHRCPVQIAYRLWQFSINKLISGVSTYIKPDEPIATSSSVYCGITNEQIARPDNEASSLEDVLTRISTLIQKIGNKNIYIIGWDVSEDSLGVLESNIKRLNIVPFDSHSLRTIDLKHLAGLALPIDEVGHLGPDTALFWLERNVAKAREDDVFKTLMKLRTERWQARFCRVGIDIDMRILALLMELLKLQAVDDVYAWLETPHKVEVLSFGKHKGERIEDVYASDNEYLCWLHSCKDIMAKNKDLKFTLDAIFAV